MKNKRGQSQVLFSILVACMLFFVGMIAVNFIKDDVTTSRTQNYCSNPITDGNKLMCIVIDFVVPYFIVFIIAVAGGLITDKFLQ
jgi:NO-binding membrane sensor protein with MHYT domain